MTDVGLVPDVKPGREREGGEYPDPEIHGASPAVQPTQLAIKRKPEGKERKLKLSLYVYNQRVSLGVAYEILIF